MKKSLLLVALLTIPTLVGCANNVVSEETKSEGGKSTPAQSEPKSEELSTKAEVDYVDPQTSETVHVDVEATDDANKVASSLYALMNKKFSMPQQGKAYGVTLDAEVALSALQTANEKNFTWSASVSEEAQALVPAVSDGMETAALINAFKLYEKLNVKASFNPLAMFGEPEDVDFSEVSNFDETVELAFNESKAYAKYSLSENLLQFAGQMLNPEADQEVEEGEQADAEVAGEQEEEEVNMPAMIFAMVQEYNRQPLFAEFDRIAQLTGLELPATISFAEMFDADDADDEERIAGLLEKFQNGGSYSLADVDPSITEGVTVDKIAELVSQFGIQIEKVAGKDLTISVDLAKIILANASKDETNPLLGITSSAKLEVTFNVDTLMLKRIAVDGAAFATAAANAEINASKAKALADPDYDYDAVIDAPVFSKLKLELNIQELTSVKTIEGTDQAVDIISVIMPQSEQAVEQGEE